MLAEAIAALLAALGQVPGGGAAAQALGAIIKALGGGG